MIGGKYIKQDVLAGKSCVGTFVSLPHPIAVELAGSAGFDVVIIDLEHSPMDRALLENLVRAADAVDVPAVVRLQRDDMMMSTALDAGACGLLVSMVDTAEEARSVVSAARFPPLGTRGVGAYRAVNYTKSLGDRLQNDNDRIFVGIMVESSEGLRNIEEICAVDGIDVIFIGPGDLSVSLTGKMNSTDALEPAYSTIIETCQRHGKRVGTFAGTAADVDRWRERGVSFFALNCDVMILAAVWTDLAKSAVKLR